MFSSLQFYRKPRREAFEFPWFAFTIGIAVPAFLLGICSGAHWNIHAILSSFTF